ncbi:MAG: carboxypeptidase regulatory-like domain-containing protein, partial [Bacteroidetes bacterium]|nr:carboxypeptidase regulatory-like domain-containing protein [Bacteroidota bacterium]
MKNFTKVCSLSVVMLLSSMLMFAQQVQITDTGPAGKTSLAPADNRAVLYEQINNPGTDAAITAQDFEASFDAFDAEGADEFTVPSGDTWNVDNVQVLGTYSAAGPCNLANVRFYADNAGVPGTLLFEYLSVNANPDANGNLDIDILTTVLGSGTYWLSVQGRMDYGTSGQWFWARQAAPTIGYEFMWQNPGDGFGSGYTTWVDGSVMWAGQTDYNLSFAINGSVAVPCDYEIALYDDFGDGWNGGAVSVYVDGTVVLNNITLASGGGPVYYTFQVTTGAEITTTYSPGGWSYENEYHIIDAMGTIVWIDGGSGSTPTGIGPGLLFANCPSLPGAFEGYVMNGVGLGIGGADVYVELFPPWAAVTNPTGYYIINDVQPGTWDVVASRDGYWNDTASVTVISGGTVQRDFILTRPQVSINPLIMNQTLHPNQYLIDYFGILNTGDG